jgi:hypothetical protein
LEKEEMKSITLQGITDTTLTVGANSEIQQIQNQLEELKSLLSTQYADKIFNIAKINEANFRFVKSKKGFNEFPKIQHMDY